MKIYVGWLGVVQAGHFLICLLIRVFWHQLLPLPSHSVSLEHQVPKIWWVAQQVLAPEYKVVI